MSDYIDEMWDDFSYYMYTGKLSEYFEEEDEEAEEVDEYSDDDIDIQE